MRLNAEISEFKSGFVVWRMARGVVILNGMACERYQHVDSPACHKQHALLQSLELE